MTILSTMLVLAATTGAPADGALVPDARCLAFFAAKVGSGDASNQFPQSAVMYFTGKLFARKADVDLVQTLRGSVQGMDEAAEGERCLSELRTVGEKLQAAGSTLSKE